MGIEEMGEERSDSGKRSDCEFPEGSSLLKQGEPCDRAFVICSGTVRIVHRSPETGEEKVLATLGEGAVVGAEALTGQAAMPHTVRACEHVSAQAVDRNAYEQLVKDDKHQDVRPFLELLRQLVAREGQGGDHGAGSEPQPAFAVELVAKTPTARAVLGDVDSVTITAFPVQAGRVDNGRNQKKTTDNGLLLYDTKPYNVSRTHFSLTREGPVCVFEDRGSRLGSVVNGVRVGGRDSRPKRIDLVPGANTLILGSRRSRIEFSLVVRSAVQPAAHRPGFLERIRQGFRS